ncbi:hypothetical protein HG530_004584 [Fusarium avenaceum]|nr:hypothetical protein HG530_004584 [Fusarium avenaceum]
MITEELVFVEHALENLLQSIFAHDGQQDTIALSSLSDTGHVSLSQIASVLNEPVNSLLERRQPVDQLWFESDGRVKRDQTHKRPHGQLLDPRAAPGDGIIVEAIVFVPKRLLLFLTGSKGHCITNEDEVLKELGCDILDTSGGQRLRAVEQTNVVKTQETSLENVLAIGILAVYPPGEVDEELLEYTLKEI